MFRAAFMRTRLLRSAVAAATVAGDVGSGLWSSSSTAAAGAAAVVSASTGVDAFHQNRVEASTGLDFTLLHDVNHGALSHGTVVEGDVAAGMASVANAVEASRHPLLRTGHEAAYTASTPARRRTATVMSKARRIRLAAAAQEAADHLQEAGSPAAAMVHSQHIDQLREEEKLLEVSLQRLRAERSLAVARHDCEHDLQRFRRGMRAREDAVASMVKAKYTTLRDELGVQPAEEAAAILAVTASPATANAPATAEVPRPTAAPVPRSEASSELVYRQGALDLGEDDHAHPETECIDVEAAADVRFLMNMDATADADDAREAAGKATATTRHRTGTARRTATPPRSTARQTTAKHNARITSKRQRRAGPPPAAMSTGAKNKNKSAKHGQSKSATRAATKKPTSAPKKKQQQKKQSTTTDPKKKRESAKKKKVQPPVSKAKKAKASSSRAAASRTKGAKAVKARRSRK